MTRSVKSINDRKLKSKKKKSEKTKNLKNALKKNTQEKKELEKELVAAREVIKKSQLRKPEKSIVTSASKTRRIETKNNKISGGTTLLSSDVMSVSDRKISEGTFGVVYLGHVTKLNIKCAVKSGKHLHLFDASHEANILQRLQGSNYFPYLFGTFENSLVMEYIGDESGHLTIYKAGKMTCFCRKNG